MNIIILSPTDVSSLNHGAARRIYHLSDNLALHGNKVTIVYVLSRHQKGRRINKTRNNAKMIGIPFFQLPLLPLVLLKYMMHADMLQLEFPLFAPLIPLVKILRKPLILDEHGVEIHYVKEISRIVKKRLSKVRYVKTLLLEWLAISLSSLVFTCSSSDAKKVKEKFKVAGNKTLVIPNGVEDDFFEPVNPHRYGKPAIIFIGDFNHAPNVYAVKVILNEILPYAHERNKNPIFAFVGRNPPQWLVKRGTEDCVKVFGNVKDVRPYLKGADIAIAPIYHGSGTRIKILEYMSLGKPVISTSKGVEGLDVENGKHVLLRDNPHEFAEAIIELLLNKNLAEKMGENSQKLIKEKYRWKDIVTLAIKAYNQLLPHK